MCVSEKTYRSILRKLPEGQMEGWKDSHGQGSKNTATITEDLKNIIKV